MIYKPTLSQKQIIDNANGHFAVRACPGSGKTFTMAMKTLNDIENWKDDHNGIALLSFTNVAQEEFAKQVNEIIPSKSIHYPHYLGTLDSFINRYIFFQFSYLLNINSGSIKMIGNPYGNPYLEYASAKLSLRLIYSVGGELSLSPKEAQSVKQPLVDAAKKAKASLIKQNKYTQSDANYFSLQIMKKYPEVVDCIAARFPIIYVDEGQDTTPVHWEILRLLSSSSQNSSFGIIGDPDQSIYAWNGAKPELFINYADEMKEKGKLFELNESRRSSQLICNFYYPMSTLEIRPNAINESVAHSKVKPEAVYYDRNNVREIADIVDDFKSKHSDSLILSRSNDLIDKIYSSDNDNERLKTANPWRADSQFAYEMLKAKYELDNKEYRKSLLRAEEVIFSLEKQYDRTFFLEKYSITSVQWFEMIEDNLRKMPSTLNNTIGRWSEEVNMSKSKLGIFTAIDFEPKNRSSLADYKATRIADFFNKEDSTSAPIIQTIHSVKGATTNSVLLIMNSRHTNHIIRALTNKPALNESEQSLDEKRMIYVAITRARLNIVLCAPDNLMKKLNAALAAIS